MTLTESVLQPLDCWDRGFESRWWHGCSSLVFVVCCVDSGLRDGLITRSEEPYQVFVRVRVCVCVCHCLSVCDLETSTMRRARPELGSCATKKKECRLIITHFIEILSYLLRVRIPTLLNLATSPTVWVQYSHAYIHQLLLGNWKFNMHFAQLQYYSFTLSNLAQSAACFSQFCYPSKFQFCPNWHRRRSRAYTFPKQPCWCER
jgi:hypothetical protein